VSAAAPTLLTLAYRPMQGPRRLTRTPAIAAVPNPGLGQLVLEHQAPLYATALRLCGSAADARDLVQDTFERALRSSDRFQAGTNLRGWLVTILHRLFIDRCRAPGRQTVEPSLVPELAAPEPDEPPAWARITPERLAEALAQLPEEFQSVYRLHALEGRSYTDIASALSLPKATVGTRLIRARRKLKALLMPEGADDKPEAQP
jgi:RNA polymerase sigma-70 factor, ECF subfamily